MKPYLPGQHSISRCPHIRHLQCHAVSRLHSLAGQPAATRNDKNLIHKKYFRSHSSRVQYDHLSDTYPNGHHSLHFDDKPRSLISENIVIVNYLPAVKSLIKLNKCLSLPSLLGSCINEISFQNKKSVLKYIHLGIL